MKLFQSENQKKNILFLFALGTFGLNFVILLLLFFHETMLQQLSQQLAPQSLIELADGRVISADPKTNLERQPETIRRFVGETMTLMLTFSSKQPQNEILAISSALLMDRFKPKFQTEMMRLNQKNQITSNNRSTESVLIIERISQPIKIGVGEWKVEIRANQLIFSGSDLLGNSIPFNRQILVRAIANNPISLPDNPLPWHLATFRLGEARLEIYNMCELQQKDCS
ncbi:MAG: hypothetical protein DCF12_03265 [Snowella sp.]|nr:MAG: hypothetical protein DCF12_03265 [Snowella sp.]